MALSPHSRRSIYHGVLFINEGSRLKGLAWLAIAVASLMLLTGIGYVAAVFVNERAFILQSHYGAILQITAAVLIIAFAVRYLSRK